MIDIPGSAAGLKGYLVKPKEGRKLPAVIVIHENRGLNPHIKDVARRLAVEGFVALGARLPQPHRRHAGRRGQGARHDRHSSSRTTSSPGRAAPSRDLKRAPTRTGKVGAVGFCWGGGVGQQARGAPSPTSMPASPITARQPAAEEVEGIKAPLLLHYAGLDERINAGIPAFEEALKAAKKTYELHIYQGANHAFNNDTNRRATTRRRRTSPGKERSGSSGSTCTEARRRGPSPACGRGLG